MALLTGPSGSGKTTGLRLVRSAFQTDVSNATGTADRSKPLIETWPTPPRENIRRLTAAGLGDPFTWCRKFDELSEGQKARFEIADLATWQRGMIMVDEFLQTLDPLTRKAVAWSAGKTLRRQSCGAILASTHDDMLADLSPDAHITLDWTGDPKIHRRERTEQRCTILGELRYRPGQPDDWKKLKHLHYAAGDPATRHSVHVLEHPTIDWPAAVAILSYPDLHSQARNTATNDAYRTGSNVSDAKRINRDVKRLSRIVVTPELRNCGLAQLLIEKIVETTPMQHLECSTQLGRYTTFLERAGFREIPQPLADVEADLHDLATTYQAPIGIACDPAELAQWCDRLSVRKRRDFRKACWMTYHHYKLHRRTRSNRPKKVPGESDPRWPDAFELAAVRLEGRPAYWIRTIGRPNPTPVATV